MDVRLDLPQGIGEHLEAVWGDLSQAAKEALAIESYRTGKLSIGGLSEMLGMSVVEAEEFLKQHRVDMTYTLQDLEADRQVLKQTHSR